jgi:glutaredoxin
VLVHEAQGEVGHRFDGDFQGPENWSTQQDALDLLRKIGMTTELTTVPNSTQCAKAKKVIEKVQPDFPELKMEYVNVTARPEILQQYRVLSAPSIVLNGKLEYTGGLDEAALREHIKQLSGG